MAGASVRVSDVPLVVLSIVQEPEDDYRRATDSEENNMTRLLDDSEL